ncbi:hypothetical protein V6N13_121609 [Hibiscus sabdariffa]
MFAKAHALILMSKFSKPKLYLLQKTGILAGEEEWWDNRSSAISSKSKCGSSLHNWNPPSTGCRGVLQTESGAIKAMFSDPVSLWLSKWHWRYSLNWKGIVNSRIRFECGVKLNLKFSATSRKIGPCAKKIEKIYR